MARPRTDIEYAKQKISEAHSGSIEILEYSGLGGPGRFECKICGNKWNLKIASRLILGKTGCPRCSKNKEKITEEQITKFMRENNCVWLSGKYDNARSKLLVKFSCGHFHETCWAHLKQGRMCKFCGIKKRSDSHKTKEEDIIQFIESNGFNFVDFPEGYVSQRKSYVRYKCSEGHITKRLVCNIYKYKTCRTCEFLDLAEDHRGEKNHFWNGGVTKLYAAIRNTIKDWKKKSVENCGAKCVITGKKFQIIHHVHAFNLIIAEALENLNMKVNIDDYTDEELNKLTIEVNKLHNKYPLGVCLVKEYHDLFHKKYGNNCTLKEWNEFLDKIKNNEICLEKEVNV